MYSIDVLLSQFGTTSLFYVWFNCCFLTCIQVSQEGGDVVWYFHLFKNFPQFIVIHTIKGFRAVNEAEVDVFLELPCFPHDPMTVGNLISGSSAFSETSLNIRKCRPKGPSRGERWTEGEELAAAFGSLVLLDFLGCYHKFA